MELALSGPIIDIAKYWYHWVLLLQNKNGNGNVQFFVLMLHQYELWHN